MTSIEMKARMFDLQQQADVMKNEFEMKVRPLRDEYHKLANELQAIDEQEMCVKK